jgi:uncharacterized protein YndB with AHSA1/START domain
MRSYMIRDTSVQGTVPLTREEAFEIYVDHIDTWWPRRGVFPYSFAPATARPRHIRFEPKPGGRFYETFEDGTEYVIGHVTDWEPPRSITYTWRDPTWEGETVIDVTFTPAENGTQVTCNQSGFAAASVPHLAPYYQIGNRQTLSGFFAHCRAVYELQQLEQNAAEATP